MTGPERKIANAIFPTGEEEIAFTDPFHTDMNLTVEPAGEDIMIVQDNDGADADIVMLTPYLARELYLLLHKVYGG